MLDRIGQTAADYFHYYGGVLHSAWKHITPTGYFCLLVSVLVVGWLLMKNSAR